MGNAYSIAEARNHLAALVHRAEEGNPVRIMRRGRSVAVLLSEKEYARLSSGQKGFWNALTSFREEVQAGETEDVDRVFSEVDRKSVV